jgi:hypothetical protein
MHLTIPLAECVAIECALKSAALEWRIDADESDRLHFHRSAEVKRWEASRAEHLANIMRAAIDAAMLPNPLVPRSPVPTSIGDIVAGMRREAR